MTCLTRATRRSNFVRLLRVDRSAQLRLRAGNLQQLREVHAGSGILSGSSLIQHFGLGSQARVDALEIRWPSGATTRLTNLAVDRLIVVREDGGRPNE